MHLDFFFTYNASKPGLPYSILALLISFLVALCSTLHLSPLNIIFVISPREEPIVIILSLGLVLGGVLLSSMGYLQIDTHITLHPHRSLLQKC